MTYIVYRKVTSEGPFHYVFVSMVLAGVAWKGKKNQKKIPRVPYWRLDDGDTTFLALAGLAITSLAFAR